MAAKQFKLAQVPLDLKNNTDKLPFFLLDLGPDFLREPRQDDKPSQPVAWKWEVICVKDFINNSANRDLLSDHGYGAISYGWGIHEPPYPQPRPSYDPKTDPVPKFPAQYSWLIPKIWNYQTPDNPGSSNTVAQSLTLDRVRAVFRTMQKRFVWWDHACIPQIDATQGHQAPQAQLSPDLKKLRSQEVDKQKTVYELADVGAVWIHQITWRQADKWGKVKDFDVSKVLLQASSLTDFTDPRKIPMFKSTDTPVTGSARATLVALLGNPNSTSAWRTAIENFLKGLEAVKDQEYWFRSLWCFQEEALLKKQAFLDYNGNLLGWDANPVQTFDRKVYPLVKRKEGDLNKDDGGVNAPCAFHIMCCTTLLAIMISTTITGSAPVREIEDIQKGPGGSDFLKSALKSLSNSGLLFFPHDSPLELVASARRGRIVGRYLQDKYYAMKGVLGLDDSIMTSDYNLNEDQIQPLFFAAIVKHYQWTTLMLAKSDADSIGWTSVSAGRYEPIGSYVGVKWPAKDAPIPKYFPKLEYDIGNAELVVRLPVGEKSGPEYRYIEYWIPTGGNMKRYTLDAAKPVSDKLTNEILFQDLTLPPPGVHSWCLIPFQRLLKSGEVKKGQDTSFDTWRSSWDRSETARDARCIYLTKWDASTAKGVFSGIVDVRGGAVAGGTRTRWTITDKDVRMKWA